VRAGSPAAGKDAWVDQFRRLEERTAVSFALPTSAWDASNAHRRYRQWLPFAHRRVDFLNRAARDLGYDPSELPGHVERPVTTS
jgi:hypothetical protein